MDIKKSSALPPAEVRKNLEVIIERIAERSKRTWTFRGKKEVSDTTIRVWNRMKNTQGGIYYEINRDHPMIKQMLLQDPNLEKPLYSLLQQIERGLPLNQLYVDLNNDEQLRNEQTQGDDEIAFALYSMLESSGTKDEKIVLLEVMSGIEPFSTYPRVIEKIRKELSV